MAKNSAIEWTDHTFNPWIGCTKVSPGCDHCYAEQRMDKRLHVVNWGAGQPRKRTSAANWREPVKWNNAHAEFYTQHGRRQRVFCASLADVFDNEVDPAWRDDLFDLITDTPNLDWLILTKRIGNARTMMSKWLDAQCVYGSEQEDFWHNVWIGATIVNQEEADRDIPKLLQVPAAKRFLSMEPLLEGVTVFSLDGPVDVPCDDKSPIDWVIVGGESGPDARPMHPEWARRLRDQCVAARTPFLFKQWGEWAPIHRGDDDHLLDDTYIRLDGTTHTTLRDDHEPYEVTDELIHRAGKKAAGRLLDGRTWDEVPA